MRAGDVWILCATASMWGASFIFMRVIAPVFGWVWAADLRVLIGGALIAAIMLWRGESLRMREDWRHFAVLGLLNSAIPFALFAFAALHVPAAYSAIANATAPLWSAMLGSILFQDHLNGRRLLGLMLGISGVALTAGAGSVSLAPIMVMAFVGTLIAALLYAISGAYMKTKTKHIKPLALGCGSQLFAALWLLPLMPFHLPHWQQIQWSTGFYMLCAGLISTGLPYVLYFPLMQRIGVTRALTVTFLVPCFAFLFAFVFLGEALSLGALGGCALVISGLVIVLKH